MNTVSIELRGESKPRRKAIHSASNAAKVVLATKIQAGTSPPTQAPQASRQAGADQVPLDGVADTALFAQMRQRAAQQAGDLAQFGLAQLTIELVQRLPDLRLELLDLAFALCGQAQHHAAPVGGRGVALDQAL